MSGFTSIYLDTNTFIHAFEEKSLRSELLTRLFTMPIRSKPLFATSELSLSELLVKPYEKADDAAIAHYETLIVTNDWLDVLAVTRPTLAYAAVLRSQNKSLKLPDAVHLATAIGACCSHFLTADEGISKTFQLIHTRYGLNEAVTPLIIIRPDEPTLTSLLKSLSV